MTRALVTGGKSGIGAAVVAKLRERGLDVAIADLPEVDVRDEELVREAVQGVDVLVNAAGIGSTTNVVDTTLEVWENVMAVNARGTFLCCKHAIPGMIERGGGSIVNVASIAGLVGLKNRAAYCASKGAIVAFTKALAVDHVKDNIRVNAVAPGTVDSPWVRRLVEDVGESLDELKARQPMGRLGTTDEIAEAILYLAFAEFATGTILSVDGGFTAA
jgi:NAD(P)-dependent dehydrogenase (short-subunit alcohol dehydrogenase family)